MSGESKFSLDDILEEERRAQDMTEEEAPKAEASAEKPAEEPQKRFKVEIPEEDEYLEEEKSEKKKEKKGFFARRREKKKKREEFNETEDMYYGIQLKPIDEYTRGFDATGEISLEQEGFKKLFDENTSELDDEVAKNFERLQKERRRRVAEAVENAGVDIESVEDELGIVAPVPVSAFSGDPYAKQHGIETDVKSDGMPDFQKAMIQDAQTRTMEIKLDIENDSVELQQAKVVPQVSEESVQKILDTVAEAENEAVQEPEKSFTDVSSFSEEKQAEMEAARPDATQVIELSEVQKAEERAEEEAEPEKEPVKISLPVNDVTEYRTRDLPVHIINADVLQSALLSEARAYSEEDRSENKFKVHIKDDIDSFEADNDDGSEQIDDYTGPADAKSIAHDLRSTMNQLTIRLLVTGVCSFVLIIASIICEAGFGPGNAELSGAIGYLVVSVIFLAVAIGFCAKTISNGISSLLALQANSDSAASVACVAVAIQTVCAFFYTSSLASGKFHLYAGAAAAILFMNTLGKLTMVRRIHSNFRFVASQDSKYAVKLCEEHNIALRIADSAVVSQPVIAYQQRADFLKRFLQISYEPDPAEISSQNIAPIGLVASLVLCVAALLVTKDPAVSIGVLAAACCVSTAVTNMLSVNLPVSRLSRRLRRSGAMVASYEGIKRMSEVNAILVDAADLFPSGTVVINGVKSFTQENLQDVILEAGALVNKVGGPLSGVFEQVLNEYEGELPEIKNAHYDRAGGVVGTINDHEILVGSRALLMAREIEGPDAAVETKLLTGNRQAVYIAADGILCAIIVLSYQADRRKKLELRELESNGVALIVRTTDANVTAQLISNTFGIDASSVRIIPAESDPACDGLLDNKTGREDAYAATKGRAESMMTLISACMDERKNISFIVAMQNAAVVIGFILVAFLTFISGIKQITTLALLVYEAFWVAASVLLPKLKNKVK